LKTRILAILALVCILTIATTGAVFAADPPPGVVTINASGNNGGTVIVNTVAPYVHDSLSLTTTGAFGLNQVNRFVESGAWVGDSNDIDRSATFSGTGAITAISNYLNTDPWWQGSFTTIGSVVSTGTGGLHQNLAFTYYNSGAYSQDQWKKQRDMQVDATGNYIVDVSNVGASINGALAPINPAYAFDINSKATSGSTILRFPSVSVNGYQALSNTASHNAWTQMNTNFILSYIGAPIINTTIQAGVAPGGTNMVITVDTINKIISGYGTIK
jgi:hypothetical protein